MCEQHDEAPAGCELLLAQRLSSASPAPSFMLHRFSACSSTYCRHEFLLIDSCGCFPCVTQAPNAVYALCAAVPQDLAA